MYSDICSGFPLSPYIRFPLKPPPPAHLLSDMLYGCRSRSLLRACASPALPFSSPLCYSTFFLLPSRVCLLSCIFYLYCCSHRLSLSLPLLFPSFRFEHLSPPTLMPFAVPIFLLFMAFLQHFSLLLLFLPSSVSLFYSCSCRSCWFV